MFLYKVQITVNLDKDTFTYFEEEYLARNKVEFYSVLPQVVIDDVVETALDERTFEMLSKYIHAFSDESEIRFEINGNN